MAINTKDILKRYNIKLTKSLGQNFLFDQKILSNIVIHADLSKNDLVVEVGPGIGTMTREIAKLAGKVIAIEIDKFLIPALSEALVDHTNVQILNADIMKVDIKELIQQNNFDSIKIIANLPYYITTPILMKFLESDVKIQSMIFMVQKEVAQRIVAVPGKKDYGVLTVLTKFYCNPEILFNVPSEYFIPKPEVDSAVIRLVLHKTPPIEIKNKDFLFKIVKASFGQRRKTLLNALFNAGFLNKTKEELIEAFNQIGLSQIQRGETLTLEQFGELSNILFFK